VRRAEPWCGASSVGDGLMGFGATILFINLFSGFISKKKKNLFSGSS